MNKIISTEFGSTLYGTRTVNSDTDYKAIYLPTKKEILLGKYKKTIQHKRNKEYGERNTSEDIDIEIFSLDRYLTLLSEGQTVSLDMLFSNLIKIENSEYSWVWEEIVNNKDKLITKNLIAFIGYAKTQAAKYGVKGSRMDAVSKLVHLLKSLSLHDKLINHKNDITTLINQTAQLVNLEKEPLIKYTMLPGPIEGIDCEHLECCNKKVPLTATVKLALEIFERVLYEYGERSKKAHLNGGVDLKAIHHCIRVCDQGVELLTTGKITFPRPNNIFLTQIKENYYSFEQLEQFIDERLHNLVTASNVSNLRDTPDHEWINNFICKVYEHVVKYSTEVDT